MKSKLLYVFVAIVLLLVLAAACPPRPEQPTCPDGYDTIVESSWVDGHWEVQEVCEEVPVYEYTCDGVGEYFAYYNWNSHTFGIFFIPYNKAVGDIKCHMPTASSLKNDYGMSNTTMMLFRRMKPDWKMPDRVQVGTEIKCEERKVWVDGAWTDPICEIPQKQGCAFKYYVLQGATFDCWLQRNYDLGDTKAVLPDRYNGTPYMLGLCNLTDRVDCDGNGIPDAMFEPTGAWGTTCQDVPAPRTCCD